MTPCDLEHWAIVMKSCSIQGLVRVHQNWEFERHWQKTVGNIVQTKLILKHNDPLWPWKLSNSHEKLINSMCVHGHHTRVPVAWTTNLRKSQWYIEGGGETDTKKTFVFLVLARPPSFAFHATGTCAFVPDKQPHFKSAVSLV